MAGKCEDSENVPEGRAGAPGPRDTPGTGLPPGGRWGQSRQDRRSPPRPGRGRARPSPWSPFPLALVQEGGGEAWGRTTGAKALFCFTAEMTLAGENEKMPCAPLQFEGRVTEEAAMVGLDGTTATKQTRSGRAACAGGTAQRARGPPGAAARARRVSGVAALRTTGKRSCRTRFQLGGPARVRFGLGFQGDLAGPVGSQFTVATWVPSLHSHPSLRPVAHITEHPRKAHT